MITASDMKELLRYGKWKSFHDIFKEIMDITLKRRYPCKAFYSCIKPLTSKTFLRTGNVREGVWDHATWKEH